MFTQPCFIKGNSQTIINNLIDIGYEKVFEDKYYNNCQYIGANNGDIIPINEDYIENLILEYGFIDCYSNRILFYALASLNNDSVDNQWFVGPNNIWSKSKNTTDYMLENGHKASVREIIEHFSK
jgi:hypothetical protein